MDESRGPLLRSGSRALGSQLLQLLLRGLACQSSVIVPGTSAQDPMLVWWLHAPARISRPQLTLMPCWLNVCEGWKMPPATNALPMTSNRLPMILPNSVNLTTRKNLQQPAQVRSWSPQCAIKIWLSQLSQQMCNHERPSSLQLCMHWTTSQATTRRSMLSTWLCHWHRGGGGLLLGKLHLPSLGCLALSWSINMQEAVVKL